jgi:hypothetical protein
MGPGVLISTSFKSRKGPCKSIPLGEHASGTGSLSGPEMGVHQPASSAQRGVWDCNGDRLDDSFQYPASGWCRINSRAGKRFLRCPRSPGEEAQLLLCMTIYRNRRNDPLSGVHFTSSYNHTAAVLRLTSKPQAQIYILLSSEIQAPSTNLQHYILLPSKATMHDVSTSVLKFRCNTIKQHIQSLK